MPDEGSLTGYRDFWQTRRLAPAVEKIRQIVTLPAVTAECGPVRGSLYVTADSSTVPTNSVAVPLASADGVTVDFYAMLLSPSENFVMLLADASILRTLHIVIVDSNTLSISVTNSGGSVTESVTCDFMGNWHRFTISYANADRKIRLYLDTVLIHTTAAAPAGTLAFPNDAKLYLGNGADTFVNGYYGELRIWDKVMTQDEINATNGYRGAVDVDLDYYVKLRALSNVPVIGSGVFATTSATALASTDEFPEMLFGASFVVAEWPVTLEQNVSLVWPLDPDSGTTGMLVVRWTDDDDVLQRRRLWDMDGVDIAPTPERYAGENVGSSFTLELWNIDGEQYCVLPDDLTVGISYTTNPTTSYDRQAQEAATITVDTTLAAAFPLTFPITFDTQQTY